MIYELTSKFKLSDAFVEKYAGKQPNWGPLGYIVYKRTYSRTIKGTNRSEEFWETCKRVVEGCFSIQKTHCKKNRLPWNEWKAQKSAQVMYDLMWNFKFLPPGRGLWSMGTDVVELKGSAALCNCALVSTQDLKFDFSGPFVWLMDMSMLGVGVAFDTKGKDQVYITKPKEEDYTLTVQDSKEGWCEVVGCVLDAFVGKGKMPKHIDYSLIRPAGEPIKTFGGIAPGPEPLIRCIDDIKKLLTANITMPVTSTIIVDLMNILGRCVVSGGVRRCLPVGTIVHTKRGLINIEDVLVNDEVRTMNGWKKVLENVYQGVQSIVTINTEIGPFNCTPQHRMKVVNDDGSYEWKRAEELTENDKLVFLNRYDEIASTETNLDTSVIDYEHVPNNIKCGTKEIKEQYIAKVFYKIGKLIDSNFNNFNIAELTNEQFLLELQTLISSLSIATTLKYDNNTSIYTLTYLNKEHDNTHHDNLVKILSLNEKLSSFKINTIVINTNLITPINVINITNNNTENETYDLSVEDDHEFVCGPGLLSHNTAELALGDYDDNEYLELKDPKKHKTELDAWRWSSNNSIYAEVGMDYTKLAAQTYVNGEPGYVWLDNMRKYGRMKDGINNLDELAMGPNPCLGKNTLLMCKTLDETVLLKEVQNIKIGDTIWSKDGWTKVVNIWSNGIKPLYRYRTTAGYIDLTEDHKIVQNGKKVKIKEAKSIDILIGDIDNNIENLDNEDIVAGLIIGDGYFNSKNLGGNSLLCIGKDDQDYFNSEITSYILTEDKHSKRSSYNTYKVLIDFENSELDYTYNRKIPQRFMDNITPKRIIGLLRGLFTANGYVLFNEKAATRRVCLKQTSRKLIDQVQILLSVIGIQSRITVNKPTMVAHKNGEYLSKENYCINIASEDMKTFRDKIGFIQKYKNEKLDKAIEHNEKCKNSPFSRVKNREGYDIISAEYLRDDEVFDLTVDNDSHTLWCNGYNVSNCGEQTLESYEVCNLVESFPSLHDSFEEFRNTLKYAYLYAKTVTLVPSHDERTNSVMLRNRRIGLSQTGITEAFQKHGKREHFNWCDKGYEYIQKIDKQYSRWLCVPESIKKTSCKPAGSVSLLPGVTPGIHYPHSEYYKRAIRISKNSPLFMALEESGYDVELSAYGDDQMVVYFPIKSENFYKSKKDVTIWEQMENNAAMQFYWADNNISQTVTVKKSEKNEIKDVLEAYEDKIKAVSFLPLDDKVYKQAPYQEITKEQYEEMMKKITDKGVSIYDLVHKYDGMSISEAKNISTHDTTEQFCDGDTCTLQIGKKKSD